MLEQLMEHPLFWTAVTVVVLALGGFLLLKFFRYEVKHLLEGTMKDTGLDAGLLQWMEEIVGVLRWVVVAVVGLLIGFAVLRAMGHPVAAGWDASRIGDWLMSHGVRLTLLIGGAYLGLKVARLLLSKVGRLIQPYDGTPAAAMERDKRAQTISTVLQKTATVVVAGVTFLMALLEVGVNVTPILTSLGVIGVALGFGAQQLVGDFLAGFFHIFENQIRVGDVAIINGTGGLVQDIRLRTTVLRGLDGTVHVFRNGSISSLSNMTKGFSFYLVDLGVAYKEDTDRVCQVVREVVAEMQGEEKYGLSILEPVEILGVDSFGDSAVNIKLRIKTLPIKQWEVGREFLRRIKYRFDQEGIEIPFPHRSIYFGEASKPFHVNFHNGTGGPAGAAEASEAEARPNS